MSDFKRWFFSQSMSSQLLLSVTAVLIIVLMMLEFIFDPWQQRINLSRSQVEDKVETIQWMQAQAKNNKSVIAAASSKSSNDAVSSSSKSSLITRIEQTSKRIKIYSSIERISPDKAGRVKVWINNADFNLWLKWVETIKSQGINMVETRISQLEENDAVNITASFQSSN